MLRWDLQCVALALRGAVPELRGSPPLGSALSCGLCCATGLGLFSVAAEAWGPGSSGAGLAGAGGGSGGGPPPPEPGAGWPSSDDTPSPCSYLTAASPSPPPVRPKSCRTRPSTVTMTVAWRSLRRHPASHPRDPDSVPWLCLRITMSAPPPMAA